MTNVKVTVEPVGRHGKRSFRKGDYAITESGIIVCITKGSHPNKLMFSGVVVHEKKKHWGKWHYAENWCKHFFYQFRGKITIEVE